MKLLLPIFLFLHACAFAQEDPSTLSAALTKDAQADHEKVSRIFQWITDNIAYRTNAGKVAVIGAATHRFNEEGDDDDSPLLPLDERVARQVLRTRLAVCDGYARLFKVLCDYAGIQAEVVIGFARANENRPSPKFGVNHYWNAVFLDGRWQLLDATWASGHVIRQGNVFVKNYDPTYFLADPKVFIRDHFPDDPRWTLLPDNAVPEEFRHSPFRHKSFVKYGITGWYPLRGVIEAQVGEELVLAIETRDPQRNKEIAPDLLVDSALFTHSSTWVFLEPVEYGSNGSRPVYRYKVENPQVQWLY